MRAFLKLSLLPLIIAIGIVFTTLVGRAQPLPESIRALKLDQCQVPCWIGIIPGKTNVFDAREKVREAFGDATQYITQEGNFNEWKIRHIATESNIEFSIYPNEWMIKSSPEQNVVSTITIYTSEGFFEEPMETSF